MVRMTKKRFTTKDIICSSYCVWDNNDKPYGNNEVVDLLNNYIEENEELNCELGRYEKLNNELDRQIKRLKDIIMHSDTEGNLICEHCKHCEHSITFSHVGPDHHYECFKGKNLHKMIYQDSCEYFDVDTECTRWFD